MGIPGFFPRMKEAGYASADKEIGRAGSESNTRAIIDGPAFAHFIFRNLEIERSAQSTTGPSISTNITYRDCANEAIAWLRRLEHHGFKVEAVFFDGSLPVQKLPVRRERLNRYAKTLDVYRKLHERVLKGSGTAGDIGQLKRARSDLAPLPFLVSAVLETLLRSEYEQRTFVVPGEADSYCVAAARKLSHDNATTALTVFTNDSDLAVYDSGKETRIVLLNTIEWRVSDGSSVLLGTEYWPSQISSKIKASSLIPLAYCLSEDRQITVRKALARLQSGLQPSGPHFEDFSSQYNVAADERTLAALKADEVWRKVLCGLDARVAELALQAEGHPDDVSAPPELNMFLPFMLENPERTSAWRVGIDVRQGAYMLLLACCGSQKAQISEYRRVGDRVSPWLWRDWDFGTLSNKLNSLREGIEREATKEQSLSSSEHWRIAVIRLMLKDYQAYHIRLPHPNRVVEVVLSQVCQEWDAVEVAAHFQAMFYSLRILLQLLRYVQVAYPNDMEEDALKLVQLLEGMPKISDFFKVERSTDEIKTGWTRLVEDCLTELDPSWRAQHEPRKQRRKRKREKILEPSNKSPCVGTQGETQEAAESSEEAADGALNGNPFAALAG